MLTKQMLSMMGQKDLEDMLEEKLKAAINAKRVAYGLEKEYMALVNAAAETGFHPKAKLRQDLHRETRSLMVRRNPLGEVIKEVPLD